MLPYNKPHKVQNIFNKTGQTVEEKRSDMDVKCNMSSGIECRKNSKLDGRWEEEIYVHNIPIQTKEDVTVIASWEFPVLDIVGRWHPLCHFDRSIRADWSFGEKSMSSISAPVMTFFNEKGRNRGTFAVS